MAYNSDGYIMIDFTEVDFRRTNQTIEGLYKRCVDVIGTNKFILVINANGRTPLPATCSFTNNQYVIDTCIYMFAISSNDNLFIRRNDVPASDIIDDSSVSVDKTWSSNKIDNELDGKQDTLTAGDNISIVNNVISSTGGLQLKTFEYTGDGNNPRTIEFPEVPKLFAIYMTPSANNIIYTDWVSPLYSKYFALNQTSTGSSFARITSSLTVDGLNFTISNNYLNNNNGKYNVYYFV